MPRQGSLNDTLQGLPAAASCCEDITCKGWRVAGRNHGHFGSYETNHHLIPPSPLVSALIGTYPFIKGGYRRETYEQGEDSHHR